MIVSGSNLRVEFSPTWTWKFAPKTEETVHAMTNEREEINAMFATGSISNETTQGDDTKKIHVRFEGYIVDKKKRESHNEQATCRISFRYGLCWLLIDPPE
jgi:hypothetical protein